MLGAPKKRAALLRLRFELFADVRLMFVDLDSHGEEGAMYKNQRQGKEDCCQRERELSWKFNCKLNSKQTKECGKLDDRVQSNRRGELEWITDRITDN